MKVFDVRTKELKIFKLDPSTPESVTTLWNDFFHHEIVKIDRGITKKNAANIISNWYRNENGDKIFQIDIIGIIHSYIKAYTFDIALQTRISPKYRHSYDRYQAQVLLDIDGEDDHFHILHCDKQAAQKVLAVKRNDGFEKLYGKHHSLWYNEQSHASNKIAYNERDLYDNDDIRFVPAFEYAIEKSEDYKQILRSHLHLFDKETKQLLLLQKDCPLPDIMYYGDPDCYALPVVLYNYQTKKLYWFSKGDGYISGPGY